MVKLFKICGLLIFMVMILVACSETEDTSAEKPTEPIKPAKSIEATKPVEEQKDEDDQAEPVAVEKEETIDTSVFEFATNVEVTDAIDLNQHVTVKLTVADDANQGMAANNIAQQTFDFLQQEDLAKAKTVTILVIQNGQKVMQYTVNMEQFKPDDTTPMIRLVMDASEIEQMSEEVKQWGETMETW